VTVLPTSAASAAFARIGTALTLVSPIRAEVQVSPLIWSWTATAETA